MTAPKSQSRSRPPLTWPDALTRIVPPLRHYLGVALVVLAVALAAFIVILVATSREVHVGSIHITRTVPISPTAL